MKLGPVPRNPVLLTSVIGENSELLPHFIEHYKNLGVTEFHLVLHLKDDGDPFRPQAEECLARYGIVPVAQIIGPWNEDDNRGAIEKIMENHPNQWWIVADLDEFQVYGKGIAEVIERCLTSGSDFVEGALIDRVAIDGYMRPIGSDCLWGQFPLAGLVTHPVCGGYIKKVVLCRSQVRLGPGQHSATNGKALPANECFIQVHHFKWSESLVERLQRRMVGFQCGIARTVTPSYPDELRRTIEYMMGQNFVINIEDPSFRFEYCPEMRIAYSRWDDVVYFVKKEWPAQHREGQGQI